MNILVCGGRDYNNWNHFRNEMEKIALEHFPRTEPDAYGNYLYRVKIIHGGASGADSLADQWAVVNWTESKVFPADWKKYGNSAGPIRNKQMLIEGKPNLVIAFPRANGQWGHGTLNMIRQAEAAGVKVIKADA